MAKEIMLKYYAPNKSYPEKSYAALKKVVIDMIEEVSPELNRRFDMNILMHPRGSKGLVRDKLGRDKFSDLDRYAYCNIIQELIRKDKMLLHKGGRHYVRLK